MTENHASDTDWPAYCEVTAERPSWTIEVVAVRRALPGGRPVG